MDYTPRHQDKFTFGLWTVGNVGRDPFGDAVRAPKTPVELVHLLGDVGAWGVNFHDNDLVPIDATPSERNQIVRDFKAALSATGMCVPMATTNLFTDPIFRDGAFTSNDAAVRAYAVQKTMRAIDLGVECGAEIYVFWGGREGTESDATKNPAESIKRFREAMNFLANYSKSQGYNLKFALEPKPNEPRGDIFLATVGHALAFIETLDDPAMYGVNPEVAHETMAGLNFLHGVAQAWESGKLIHIDLNDQVVGRYDQDFRFGSANIKGAFHLVKFLEDVGYNGPKHFDAHAFRTDTYDGVKEFAKGCMRTYLILKEKAARWNSDKEIQALVQQVNSIAPGLPAWQGGFTPEKAKLLSAHAFDRPTIAAKGQPYERLDQLTMEVIMGVR